MASAAFLVLILGVLGLLHAEPAAFDPELEEIWSTFKDNHNKQYSNYLEEKYRRLVWEDNVRYIHKHNLEADLGLHTYTLGINKYADLSAEEFGQYLTGYRPSNNTKGSTFIPPDNIDVPNDVDWRRHGYVTGVKDQEQCGSCWAFSATGCLEGQHFKKTGKLVSLSEQNLVDCSLKEGNMGCSGGLQAAAYEYIKLNDGIDTEASYPYQAKNLPCRFRRQDVGATDTGFVNLPKGSEAHLEMAVATVGPISVGMDASRRGFHLYKHGVYTDSSCSSKRLDHGVLAVGYGELDGKSYWLVKNSWGTSYGTEGYVMIARNHNNMCGIATDANYPLV